MRTQYYCLCANPPILISCLRPHMHFSNKYCKQNSNDFSRYPYHHSSTIHLLATQLTPIQLTRRYLALANYSFLRACSFWSSITDLSRGYKPRMIDCRLTNSSCSFPNCRAFACSCPFNDWNFLKSSLVLRLIY